MESLDYNYFASTPQPYQYLGFGADSALSSGDGQHDAMDAARSLEQHLGTNAFLSGSFDYGTFHASLGSGGGTGLTSLPTGSASPPAQKLSLGGGRGSSDNALDMDADVAGLSRRSSSEEKESLTPAQSRRKAQNRAAQRAFRERKERHVRDLEAKLNALTSTTCTLQSDNERLKLMLQKAQTENEILRATASSPPGSHGPPGFVDDPSLLPASTPAGHRPPAADEPHVDPTRLANGVLSTEPTPSGRKRASPSDGGGSSSRSLLSASATWDLLQLHPLYLSGAVDIGEVCERLKKMARCDGMGPMFEEDAVRRIIEEVGRSGGDELI